MLALSLLLLLASMVLIYAAYTGNSVGSLLTGGLNLSGSYTPKEATTNDK